MGILVKRRENWPTLLNQFVDENRSRPFAWGSSDCALFVADAIEAFTGNDYGAAFRGKYTTAIGSIRVLKKIGHDSLSELITQLFGEPIPAGLLQRGDVALFNTGVGDTVGIVLGPMVAAQGEHGIEFISMHHCTKGWSVCRKR